MCPLSENPAQNYAAHRQAGKELVLRNFKHRPPRPEPQWRGREDTALCVLCTALYKCLPCNGRMGPGRDSLCTFMLHVLPATRHDLRVTRRSSGGSLALAQNECKPFHFPHLPPAAFVPSGYSRPEVVRDLLIMAILWSAKGERLMARRIDGAHRFDFRAPFPELR